MTATSGVFQNTNFNQQAALQQERINAQRAAQQYGGQSALACCPADPRDSVQIGSNRTPGREPFANYQESFAGPYIKDFSGQNARGMLAAAGNSVASSGANGSQEIGQLLQDAAAHPEKMDGGAVKKLQSFLQAQGFNLGNGGCDGKLGPDTHKALMGFMHGAQGSSPNQAGLNVPPGFTYVGRAMPDGSFQAAPGQAPPPGFSNSNQVPPGFTYVGRALPDGSFQAAPGQAPPPGFSNSNQAPQNSYAQQRLQAMQQMEQDIRARSMAIQGRML